MKCLEPLEFEFESSNNLSTTNYQQMIANYIDRSPALSFLQSLLTECFKIVLPCAILFIAVFWIFDRWQ